MDCILPGSCVRGFSRLEYWSGLPFPSPGDLSQEGLNPHLLYLLHWQASSSPLANQTILKEISPGCSMEGLMLKLKLQYFGHLMRRVDSLEKTLMLGGIGGRRRRGWQRMRWLDSITYSMDMLLLLLLSRSVTSDSVRPHRRQPIRLHHPWDSPGKNTEVGCHFLLQCMKVKSLSCVQLLATPWTAAYQAPPSMGFSRQEYWSGVPLPSPQWTWVWVNSRRWWWTGRSGVLRFVGSQRVGHDWATELNWALTGSLC